MSVMVFISLGGAGLAVIGLVSRRGWKTCLWVVLPGFFLLAYALISGYFDEPLSHSISKPWWSTSPWQELLLFLAMILGMTAKTVWDAIEARRTRMRRASGDRGLRIDPWEFAQPMLVSVIVFGAVIGAKQPAGIPGLVFSFQNGFFWQTVLRKQTR